MLKCSFHFENIMSLCLIPIDPINVKLEPLEHVEVNLEANFEANLEADFEAKLETNLEVKLENNVDVDKKPTSKNKYYVAAGYKEEYPISREEYDNIRAKGLPFTCPKCNKIFHTRRSFDKHLLKKCNGIPMVWPNWKKVNEYVIFFFIFC